MTLWQMIKNTLKYILPPPTGVFQREMNRLYSENERLMRTIKDLHMKSSKEIEAQKKEIAAQIEKGNKLQERMNRQIISIQQKIDLLEPDLEHRMNEFMAPELYEHALKMWYTNITGEVLNLDAPQGYNAKIQWLKLNDHDPRKSILADKYRVREYVKEKIGEKYLVPLLAVYHRAEDIDFAQFPNSFVLKANHGSGFNAIVRDKNKEDLESLRKKANGWLRTNFSFSYGYEMHYSDIPRRLIIEEYLENMDGDLPDYKFWCFDGKVKIIEVIKGRKIGAEMAMFDKEWNLLPFRTRYPQMKTLMEKPANLQEMINISECLSDSFTHARIDLYLLDDGTVKFGEITFTTSSGACKWYPPEADYIVGEMLHLPL